MSWSRSPGQCEIFPHFEKIFPLQPRNLPRLREKSVTSKYLLSTDGRAGRRVDQIAVLQGNSAKLRVMNRDVDDGYITLTGMHPVHH
ncbi:hypothetical protein TREMEDRAFT_72446, partial [Tremella mesenterica DSM 1558]|uniref:uncharacterized protein n=1 Tax=Tremella mesenterica (strain ATCC 24925 / CBS 8224 / DSM 1558 / NBRC 9311 / NRRL Y-6157 / RJB 2259-6 / UBC 559-6) TaxID=578456 RepID=UPI00032C5605